MICINCGSEQHGTFCSNCSQRLVVKRITFKEGWFDFWARIYGFDGQFPRTFRDLSLRAGFAAREFIRGNRARYYGPVGYFFLMITIYLLWLSIIDLQLVDFVKKVNQEMGTNSGNVKTEFMDSIQQFSAENIKLLAFLYVPLMAFVSQRIMFRKQGLNFMEHSILPMFVLGHWYWPMIAVATVFKYTGYLVPVPIEWLANAAYVGWSYTSFAPDQAKVKTFFKGIGIYAIALALFALSTALIMIVWIIVLALTDPEALKQIIKTS